MTVTKTIVGQILQVLTPGLQNTLQTCELTNRKNQHVLPRWLGSGSHHCQEETSQLPSGFPGLPYTMAWNHSAKEKWNVCLWLYYSTNLVFHGTDIICSRKMLVFNNFNDTFMQRFIFIRKPKQDSLSRIYNSEL